MFKFLKRSSHKLVVVHAEDLQVGDPFKHNALLVRVEEIKDLGPDDIYVLVQPIANGEPVPAHRPRLLALPRQIKILTTRPR